MLPVIQFSTVDDFIRETKNRPCEGTCRVWTADWSAGGDSHVTVRRKGVVCQALVLNGRSQPISVAMVTVLVGSYQEIYGRPFGPHQEWRAREIEAVLEEARAQIEDYMVMKLNADWRIAGGSIHTGLTGKEITAVYWDGFDDIYDRLRKRPGDDDGQETGDIASGG